VPVGYWEFSILLYGIQLPIRALKTIQYKTTNWYQAS